MPEPARPGFVKTESVKKESVKKESVGPGSARPEPLRSEPVRPGSVPVGSGLAASVTQLQRQVGNRATLSLLDAAAPVGASRPMLQRLISVMGQAPLWYRPYQALVLKYNERRKAVGYGIFSGPPERKAALVELGLLERAVYQWFGDQRQPDVVATAEGPVMRDLLDQLQNERIDLVRLAMKDENPPVTNFEHLGLVQQNQVRTIWQQLLDGNGITIKGDKEFRIRVLADFSRLLETATGRRVVGALAGGGVETVTITATTLSGGKFAASPLESDLEGIEAIAPPAEADQAGYPPLDFTAALTIQQRKEALNDIRLRHPGAAGFSLTTGQGVRYFRFNRGTASTLTVPMDATDGSLHSSSRGLGVHGEEIIAPVFVNLAHELGHVLRSLQGIGGNSAGAHELVGHAFPDVVPDLRLEEFFNIDAVENRVRAEAGLSLRGGHSNWVGQESMRLQQLVAAVRDRLAALLSGPLDQVVRALDVTCEAMVHDLVAFAKQGGNPAPVQARVLDLGRRADDLEERARGPLQGGASSTTDQTGGKPSAEETVHRLTARQLRGAGQPVGSGRQGITGQPVGSGRQSIARSGRRSTVGPPTVQRFGIDDRSWSEVTAVEHLGATAYQLSTAKGEALVVKTSGNGLPEYQVGQEGPVQETVAANLGGIAALGVATARTVMVQTASDEGQQLLALLGKLGAHELAKAAATAEVVLVMERAPGERADRAGDIVAASSPPERARLFYRLGRLWAFDVLINNTDRFYAGNWGNVILGSNGSVVGIDQMIGLAASNLGKDFAEEEARAKLKVALDPGRRRGEARNAFVSLASRWGPASAPWEGPFVLNFELGVLEGLEAVTGLKPGQLEAQLDEMPNFAQGGARDLGLGGAEAMQHTIAGSSGKIGGQLAELRGEMSWRQQLATYLAEPSRLRRELLGHLAAQATRLGQDWQGTDKWWTGKDAYWGKRQAELAALKDYGRQGFLDAWQVPDDEKFRGSVRSQLEEWQEGLELAWATTRALAQPLRSPHDMIKPLLDELGRVTAKELARRSSAEAV